MNELFKDNLSKSLNGNNNYSYFNTSILKDGVDTNTTNNQKNKVYFNFSRKYILTMINARYALISDYLNLRIFKEDSSLTK